MADRNYAPPVAGQSAEALVADAALSASYNAMDIATDNILEVAPHGHTAPPPPAILTHHSYHSHLVDHHAVPIPASPLSSIHKSVNKGDDAASASSTSRLSPSRAARPASLFRRVSASGSHASAAASAVHRGAVDPSPANRLEEEDNDYFDADGHAPPPPRSRLGWTRLREAVSSTSKLRAPLTGGGGSSGSLGMRRGSHQNSFSMGSVADARSHLIMHAPALPRIPGAAPGVDVDSESVDRYFGERLSAKVTGMVVEYDAEKVAVRGSLDNDALCAAIVEERSTNCAVRWVHVDGVSWDVIKTLSSTFGLHPLSIEDAMHIPQRVKVDNFPNHLYVSLLVCRLSSHFGRTADVAEQDASCEPARRRLLKQRKADASAEWQLVDVEADNCSLFLMDNGTVVSMTHHDASFITDPIVARLMNSRTTLRSQPDASFLLNAIIDSIVDHYLPITDAYAEQFEQLEAIVFDQPKIDMIRYLHSTFADLIELKQRLVPVQALIRSLRNTVHLSHARSQSMSSATVSQTGANMMSSTERISPQTKTYLCDVQDHIDTLIDTIATLQAWAQSLSDLTFNCISYQTNENMKVLTVASVVFLPITFLAGVYGMNFDTLPELHYEYSYPIFWSVCVTILLLTLWYLRKRNFF
ncbi:hypothetical protein BC828DRAFT_386871 [Blastocladiella britannica]|nr:hypothetical protein BC828DRAFT_386871 [Blastocladiella britannica]